MAYLEAHRHDVVDGREVGVEPICAVLKEAGVQIAPSSYYAAKTRPPSARAVADEERLVAIRQIHADNYGVYGVRKIHAELNRRGHRIPRCTVHRLMRADGLRGISRAKGPRTTIPGTGPDSRPDLLDRDFKAPAPNRVWVADITYCRTFAGWVYAAFVIDVFSRRVVDWHLSRNLRSGRSVQLAVQGRAGPKQGPLEVHRRPRDRRRRIRRLVQPPTPSRRDRHRSTRRTRRPPLPAQPRPDYRRELGASTEPGRGQLRFGILTRGQQDAARSD